MTKKIQFKPQHGRMVVQGIGEVTNANLNESLYNKLIERNPAYAGFFDVTTDEPKELKKETKVKPKENE